jgi:epoxide hydrolase-like predicted phosphatase
MSARIDAVLFDFGGVFTHSPFDAVEQLGEEMGARPGHLQNIVFGPYHEDTDHPWHRLERGEISLLDARDEVISIGRCEGLDFDPFALLARATAGRGVRQEFVDCAHALRGRGIRTAMVTNNVREFSETWQKMIPVETLFDTIVDSSAIGMRKPAHAIYHFALTELGRVPPARAVFLDDHPANVEAAVDIGLHGVLVEADSTGALAALERILTD